ncbi:MAG: substrate-binding domain-containing protein [Rubricella sp.]
MNLLKGMKQALGGALVAGAALVAAHGALAQQVTLSSYDGSITLRGNLVEFDGQNYRIATAIGEITIDAFQVSCEGEACPPPSLLASEFTIAGSNTIGASLMPALIEAYAFALDADLAQTMTDQEGVDDFAIQDLSGADIASITLSSTGSSDGLQALFQGEAQLAMASRPVREREVAAFVGAGLGDPTSPGQEHIVGLDGLIAIVSRSNPIQSISVDNLARIFAGQITNWSQIGGPDAPVSVYARDADSGTRASFEALVLEPFGLSVTPRAQVFSSNAELSDAVAADPFGIGFVGFASERNARAIGIQEVCGIVTAPTPFAIKAEEYPLARRLYLYQTNEALPPVAQNLVDFIESDEAQDVVAQNGFIDQAISSARIDEQGRRLATAMFSAEDAAQLFQLRELAQTLVSAERLSTTFRFQPGSSLLDVRAQADARRLAEYLSSGEYDNREVLILGFTDSIGRPDLNQALSFRRAQQVLDEVLAAASPGALAGVEFTVAGYGEISPLGCNETFNGRRINRRVEVWVRDRV